ncbi:MAG: flavodoxin family protein [Gemmatimonadetes bacterium]|jgi:NAD(P)H dehydrogenase (quinone)|nr:flavodoxin family protein [Gemmatimonadota bacterium]
MAKVLVLYYSKEGNTKKMAAYVAAGAEDVPETEIRLKSIDEASREDLLWCDGLALGAPTNLGTVPWKMKKFWDEEVTPVWMQIDGKIGCAFSSQGGWGGGAELTCQSLMTIMMNFGMLVFGLTDYAGKQFTAHYGVTQAGEPREEKEIEACRILGKRLAEWVAVYFDGHKEMHPNVRGYKRMP